MTATKQLMQIKNFTTLLSKKMMFVNDDTILLAP